MSKWRTVSPDDLAELHRDLARREHARQEALAILAGETRFRPYQHARQRALAILNAAVREARTQQQAA